MRDREYQHGQAFLHAETNASLRACTRLSTLANKKAGMQIPAFIDPEFTF